MSMDLLTDILPAPVSAVFNVLMLAEAALERHKEELRYVDQRNLFWALRPSDVLRMATAEFVYERHCDELIKRTIAGEDRRPGTDAEVLCALLACSLKAPLRQNALALCEHLAVTVLGTSFDHRTKEAFEGQVLEDLADARRQLAQEWRR